MHRPPLAAAAMALTVAAAVTSCSLASQPPLTYAPAAYGVPGYCYYVDSPAEAIALENAGLCPRSWVPALMPLAWHEEYWDYYDSPAYYGTYVPVRYRTVYVRRETSFGRVYRTAIATRSRLATYRSSSGQRYRGSLRSGGSSGYRSSGSRSGGYSGGSFRSGSGGSRR